MVYLQDYGRPPMTNSSFLLVMVGDVDDMAPAFNRAQYEAHVVGEKPIKVNNGAVAAR